MHISGPDRPCVHDLLQIEPNDLDASSAAEWVKEALVSCPWVVVRRLHVPAGQVAVGVRGNTRGERWGGFVRESVIRKIVRPPEVLARAQSSAHDFRTSALRVLPEVAERWRDLTLPWGPTGSVGFELATGRQVTTETSDLDVAIFAPERFSVELARSLWERVIWLETKVDIRVETPQCGFPLHEYVRTSAGKILLRYPDGPRFGHDPWCARPNTTPIGS